MFSSEQGLSTRLWCKRAVLRLTNDDSVWFVQIANNFGQNKEYDEEEKEEFRKNPKALVEHAKVEWTASMKRGGNLY